MIIMASSLSLTVNDKEDAVSEPNITIITFFLQTASTKFKAYPLHFVNVLYAFNV